VVCDARAPSIWSMLAKSGDLGHTEAMSSSVVIIR